MASADFEALWRTHFRRVARTAFLVTGDAQEAMDVAQEAFVRGLQHWRTVSKLERPEAWIHRVATNLAISEKRRRRPRPLVAEQVLLPSDPPDDELARALRSLTPAQRAVIAMRFYLDWPVDEVARALRKRPGTVRALTHQGMERLREILSKERRDG